MIAGVADECPTWPIGFAEEIGQISRAHKAPLLFALSDTFGQVWCRIESLEEVSFNVGTEGMELGMRPGNVDAGKILVRGKGDEHAIRSAINVRLFEGNAAPIAIVGACQGGFRLVGWGLH